MSKKRNYTQSKYEQIIIHNLMHESSFENVIIVFINDSHFNSLSNQLMKRCK